MSFIQCGPHVLSVDLKMIRLIMYPETEFQDSHTMGVERILIDTRDPLFMAAHSNYLILSPEYWSDNRHHCSVYIETKKTSLVLNTLICLYEVSYDLRSLLPQHRNLFPNSDREVSTHSIVCAYDLDNVAVPKYVKKFKLDLGVSIVHANFLLLWSPNFKTEITVCDVFTGTEYQQITLPFAPSGGSMGIFCYKNDAFVASSDMKQVAKIYLPKKRTTELLSIDYWTDQLSSSVLLKCKFHNDMLYLLRKNRYLFVIDTKKCMVRRGVDLGMEILGDLFYVYKDEFIIFGPGRGRSWAIYKYKLDALLEGKTSPYVTCDLGQYYYYQELYFYRDEFYKGTWRFRIQNEPNSEPLLHTENINGPRYRTFRNANGEMERRPYDMQMLEGGSLLNSVGYLFHDNARFRFKWQRSARIRIMEPFRNLSAEQAYTHFTETYDNEGGIQDNKYYVQMKEMIIQDTGFIYLLYEAYACIMNEEARATILKDTNDVVVQRQKRSLGLVALAGERGTGRGEQTFSDIFSNVSGYLSNFD